MASFVDRKPVHRQPKVLALSVGAFRIRRGLDTWVVFTKGTKEKRGEFVREFDLLIEAEPWCLAETKRRAAAYEERMRKEAQREADEYTELSMRAAECGMTVYEYTGGEQANAEDLLEQRDYM